MQWELSLVLTQFSLRNVVTYCDVIFGQVAQLSQRNRAAARVSFGWVVDNGVGQ